MQIKELSLPKISDPRGNLTFIQFPDQIPFAIQRVFWTYNVPGGQIRGGHAYKTQQEVIIAISGSFDIVVKQKTGEEVKFQLNRGYQALYLPPNTWRHLDNFSTNAVSLHLASGSFDENDYIRNFKELIKD